MREYIKQLKVCIKWFQENLEDLVKEKDHLRTLLDSSERKRVETGKSKVTSIYKKQLHPVTLQNWSEWLCY